MMKFFVFLLFYIVSCNAICQTVCFRVDSIVVRYIPWESNPRISIEEEDFKYIDSYKKHFVDSTVISNFLQIPIENKVFKKDSFSIDIRMIIEIWFFEKYISIAMDKHGFYIYKRILFERNPKLIEWINDYVTEFK